MTQEEKQLLLKDLCARLPYGVKIQRDNVYDADAKVVETLDLRLMADDIKYNVIEGLHIKPYLRPISSMTEEEKKDFGVPFTSEGLVTLADTVECIDWLNAHHFDFHGLTSMGLALEDLSPCSYVPKRKKK